MDRNLDLCPKILVKLKDKGINEDIGQVEGFTDDEFYYNAGSWRVIL